MSAGQLATAAPGGVRSGSGEPLRATRPARPRGFARTLGGIRRLLGALLDQLRYRARFAAFGWRSRLGRPDLLTGAGRIAIAPRVEIHKRARLEAVAAGPGAPVLRIGEGTRIHLYFHCGAAESVEIGRNVLIAGRVFVTDHDHDLGSPGHPPIASRRLRTAPTVIEDDCWLGEGAIVLKGVRVGRGSIVAAGAVVATSVPPYTVVAGVPARPLRRFDEGRGEWVRA